MTTERPTIVCLCGSTRFYREYQIATFTETMAGRIVLSVGFYPHANGEHGPHGEQAGISAEDKVRLDELHKKKIDISDEILVIAVGGYVGQSTASEIAYAEAHGKRVRWWDPEMRADTEEEKAAIAEQREGIADTLREMYGPAEGEGGDDDQ